MHLSPKAAFVSKRKTIVKSQWKKMSPLNRSTMWLPLLSSPLLSSPLLSSLSPLLSSSLLFSSLLFSLLSLSLFSHSISSTLLHLYLCSRQFTLAVSMTTNRNFPSHLMRVHFTASASKTAPASCVTNCLCHALVLQPPFLPTKSPPPSSSTHVTKPLLQATAH